MYLLIRVSFATLYNSELLTRSCFIVIVYFSIELIIYLFIFLPLIFTDIEQVSMYIVCMAFVIIQITSLSLKIRKKHTMSV
jgi:hypothetical protein